MIIYRFSMILGGSGGIIGGTSSNSNKPGRCNLGNYQQVKFSFHETLVV